MPKMESIIRAEKDNEKVIIYVKNDDGSEIRQEYPLFNEQGKPNAVANMIYDFAVKKIAEQSKTLNTNNVQTTITSDSKPAQSTTNSIQAPVQSTPQIGNIINTPSDLILAIQKLNPNVDILLSKSALNNHAPERMGINVDINNIKLPQGSSFEKNDDNIKLKYNGTNISIDVCPSAKRGEVDIFYWKGSPLDGIKLTKDIKDLSMSTDALEVANALNELNPHDIFRINNGKLETSINYDYYKILCPLGIDYVYDKQTHTAHLENRAGLKLDVEYNYRMDLELAKLTDPETAKYKGHVVLRDHYPTEEQKRIALASIDTPLVEQEIVRDKFNYNGDLLIKIQQLNPRAKILIDADASKASFLDVGMDLQDVYSLILPEGYKIIYDEVTGFGEITSDILNHKEIHFGKINPDGTYMKKAGDTIYTSKGRLMPKDVTSVDELIETPDETLDKPVEGEYEFSNNGEFVLVLQKLNPTMDVAVSNKVNPENPFNSFGISIQNIDDLKLPVGYVATYDENRGIGKITNGNHELMFMNMAFSKPIDMHLIPKDIKDLSQSNSIDELVSALSALNPSERFEVKGRNTIGSINDMIPSVDITGTVINTSSSGNENQPTILLPLGYRFLGNNVINQSGNMFTLNDITRKKDTKFEVDEPGVDVKQIVSRRAPENEEEKVFIFKRALDALRRLRKENNSLGKAV